MFVDLKNVTQKSVDSGGPSFVSEPTSVTLPFLLSTQDSSSVRRTTSGPLPSPFVLFIHFSRFRSKSLFKYFTKTSSLVFWLTS